MADPNEKVAQFIELQDPGARLPLACSFAARHYERGETVGIYAPDPEQAAELDRMLWTFRQDAFIPHVRLEEAEEPTIEPVILFGDDPGVGFDLLILICDGELPDWAARFAHIYDFAAVYGQSERQASRDRFAACQKAGYRMRFIKP